MSHSHFKGYSLTLFFIAICTSTFAQWGPPPPNQTDRMIQSVTLPELPSSLNFCNERMPIENFDVKESLSREMSSITYWHSSMIYTLQLANRYMAIIENILKQNGIPDDFKYLCVAESNLQNLISPARAVGYWQLLEGTGKDFGVEINGEVDERYHLEKSTVAACKYLKGAYKKFGNWTLAAASYNVGLAHVSRQIEAQQSNSYYDLYLNDETARYVYRAVAYKIIMQNPEKYGFSITGNALFPPLRYTEVQVTGAVNDWVEFALKNGTNYKMLKYFNPWLRSTKLTNKAGKTYFIRIPEKNFRQTAY